MSANASPSDRALLIAAKALVQISLGDFAWRIDERGLREVETPREIADRALLALQAINEGRA